MPVSQQMIAALQRRLVGDAAKTAADARLAYQHSVAVPFRFGKTRSALRITGPVVTATHIRVGFEVDDAIAPQAKFQNNMPKVIRPKAGRGKGARLRWQDPFSGTWISAHEVHPSQIHNGWWSVKFRDAVHDLYARLSTHPIIR